jgi:uncharacterized protein YbjT (DUF2867 family)
MAVIGDALNSDTFTSRVPQRCTYLHLVGVPRPAPWKGRQFRAVDLPSVTASVAAAVAADVSHFIYVSVAHPAPIMKAYIEVRKKGEALIRATGIPASILRPWYVLGPSHCWPLALLPLYKICERIPVTSEASRRLGLVTLKEMINALVWAIEHPPAGLRVLQVTDIREVAGTA